jgi:hypothetical protein
VVARRDTQSVRIPIACTLTERASHDRVDEWRRFLARSVTAMERANELECRFQLAAFAAVGEAVELAQREKACCSFFEFSIRIEATACWLVVSVPPEASAVLADFSGLLPDRLQVPLDR